MMIRELIRKGRLENSIYELQNVANRITDKYLRKRIKKDSDLLLHNFSLNKWQYSMGTVNIEAWNTCQARIANAVLEILGELEKELDYLTIKNNHKVSFSRIVIDSEKCCWENRLKDQQIENPIFDFHEQMTEGEISNKISDPIFDITIINRSLEPYIISHIGINPISAKDDIKGIPISGKIEVTEGYILQIEDFILGKDELLGLDNPIYMESKAPFRFTLQLKDYNKIATKKGNDTVIKIIIGANNHRVESPLIKMGMY